MNFDQRDTIGQIYHKVKELAMMLLEDIFIERVPDNSLPQVESFLDLKDQIVLNIVFRSTKYIDIFLQRLAKAPIGLLLLHFTKGSPETMNVIEVEIDVPCGLL